MALVPSQYVKGLKQGSEISATTNTNGVINSLKLTTNGNNITVNDVDLVAVQIQGTGANKIVLPYVKANSEYACQVVDYSTFQRYISGSLSYIVFYKEYT